MQERQQCFAERMHAYQPVKWELIPDLGLYMDQVVTYLERVCDGLLNEGERVFTPSMVNNYVKFGLVDRPDGKKYGREQLAQLLMIGTLKQAASVEGMKALLVPPEGMSLQEHYESFCQLQTAAFEELLSAMPFPSAMACTVRGAAYHFLCNAILQKEPEPPIDPKHVKHVKKEEESEEEPEHEA